MTGVEEQIRQSELYCRDVTRRSSSSFYLPFMVLPKKKRVAFEVVYAFMRLSDDLSDDAAVEARADRMDGWRLALRRALAGDPSVHPVMPALLRALASFEIPAAYLEELIDGTEMDLTVSRYATFDELYRYCYRVASVVGLVSLRIFGLHTPTPENWRDAEAMAEACGVGFQLTNILRDIKEDIERERIYVPLDELERFGLAEQDKRAGRNDAAFLDFMRFQVERADSYYERSRALADMLAPDARPCFLTMRGIYHGILEKIVAQGYDIWSARARVPLAQKLGIAARAFLSRRSS